MRFRFFALAVAVACHPIPPRADVPRPSPTATPCPVSTPIAIEPHARALVEAPSSFRWKEVKRTLTDEGRIVPAHSVPLYTHCILDDDGAAFCRTGTAPYERVPLKPALAIVARYNQVCALETGGTVRCFDPLLRPFDVQSVALAFTARRIVGTDWDLLLEAEDGKIHRCAYGWGSEREHPSCTVSALDVADVGSFIYTGQYECRLDPRTHAPSCIGIANPANDRIDRAEHPVRFQGMPAKAARLVFGMSATEWRETMCVLDDARSLYCFRAFGFRFAPDGTTLTQTVERTAFPGSVRDVVIGWAAARAVLEDGRVFDFEKNGYAFEPIEVPLDGLAEEATEHCVRFRSGRVSCSNAE